MLFEQLPIESFPTIDYFGQGVVLFDESPAALTHLLPLCRPHLHDRSHGDGESGWIAYGNDQPGSAQIQGVAGAGAVGGYDGQAGCLSFEDADRQAFPQRGEDECVGLGEQRLDVGMEAQKFDATGDVELVGERAEMLLLRTGSDDPEMGAGFKQSKGAEEGRIVLDESEAAYGDPGKSWTNVGRGLNKRGQRDAVGDD